MGTAFNVRPATFDDAAGIARVHSDSARDSYGALAATYTEPSVDERAGNWARWMREALDDDERIDVVAEIDGEVAGFATAGPPRRTVPGAELEFYIVHVSPAHRGRGIGSALWTDVCERVRTDALRSMFLVTFAELRASAFYAARGGEGVDRKPRDYMGGAVTEVVYRWAAGQSHAVAPYHLRPAGDDDFELIFGLKQAAYAKIVESVYGEWDEAGQREKLSSKYDPAHHQVIIAGGRAVGEVALGRKDGAVFLSAIELHPDSRGQGIGTAVLDDIIKDAEGEGVPVALQVFTINEAAIRLYERLGFKPTGATKTHTIMQRG